MLEYNKIKLDDHETEYTLLHRYRLYYGDNKSLYYCVDFNKKYNTDCIFVMYSTGISCDKIGLFEANFSGSYAFAIVDYKKQISYEYYDVFGEMVDEYIMTDKFENKIYITPVNGIIIVSILGRNKTEADYDYFNEIIVNACHNTEA